MDVVTQNSLKYYNICLEPQPIISHCLDLRTLLNSFAENIKKDMLVLTPRAFQVNFIIKFLLHFTLLYIILIFINNIYFILLV